MKKIKKTKNINPDPYEDIIHLEKLDPYESLINAYLVLKQDNKSIE